jgi:hypothetical protein
MPHYSCSWCRLAYVWLYISLSSGFLLLNPPESWVLDARSLTWFWVCWNILFFFYHLITAKSKILQYTWKRFLFPLLESHETNKEAEMLFHHKLKGFMLAKFLGYLSYSEVAMYCGLEIFNYFLHFNYDWENRVWLMFSFENKEVNSCSWFWK